MQEHPRLAALGYRLSVFLRKLAKLGCQIDGPGIKTSQ
jgi:hypothetical protein